MVDVILHGVLRVNGLPIPHPSHFETRPFLPSHPSLSLFSDRLRVRFEERGGHGEWLSCAVPLAAEEEEVVTDVRDKEEEDGEDS